MSQALVERGHGRSRVRWSRELWVQVLVAAVLGILVGLVFPRFGSAMKPLSDWFIALITMIVAPVIFCVVTTGIASMDNVRRVGRIGVAQLGYLILLFTLTCVVYVVVVLGGIMRLCKLGLFALMRFLKDELLIALATCSSEAVLPQFIRRLEKLGVGRPVVGITVPSGFSFNLDGSAVYLTMASLFLAQAVDIHLSWQQQLITVGIMMLTSKGTAGVAGGAFVMLASRRFGQLGRDTVSVSSQPSWPTLRRSTRRGSISHLAAGPGCQVVAAMRAEIGAGGGRRGPVRSN